MRVTTKGKYALSVMIDLAENDSGAYIPMKTVAERQGLPLKYLEHILPTLTQNRIVEGVHGKGGGYRLIRKPDEYTVGEILRLVEGDLAPVSCLESTDTPCEQADKCRTHAMWKNLQDMIDKYLDSVTIADLMRGGTDKITE